MAGTRTFEVDFDNNLVKQLDVKYKIEKIPRRHAKISCHVFKVKEDMKKISSSVQLTPGKKVKLPWLYGPATNLETKTIIRVLVTCVVFHVHVLSATKFIQNVV